MATLPDITTLQEGLIEIFALFHHGRPRQNDGLQWGSIREEWDQKGFNATDFNQLVAHMTSEGTLVENEGLFTLTDVAVQKGLITLPTLEEIEKAILDYFKFANSRVGDTQIPHVIQMALFEEGFTAKQFAEGYTSLIQKGQLEPYMNMLKLTQLGFEAM